MTDQTTELLVGIDVAEAIRCNRVIRRFADRLKAAGKKPKVVITACMRKLLTIINAMIRDKIQWHQLKLLNNP